VCAEHDQQLEGESPLPNREESAWSREQRNSLNTCGDDEATLASVRHPRYCTALINGSGAGCDLGFGNSGSKAGNGLRNFANVASDGTSPPKRRAVQMAPGGSRTALLSASRCQMPTATRSISPFDCVALSSTRRTAVYGPVRTVVSQGQRVTAYLCQLSSKMCMEGCRVLGAFIAARAGIFLDGKKSSLQHSVQSRDMFTKCLGTPFTVFYGTSFALQRSTIIERRRARFEFPGSAYCSTPGLFVAAE
jgi:hypothetical protein